MNHPIADAVEAFLFSRDQPLETYKLAIFHETTTWDECILSDLDEDGSSLDALLVYAVRITDLKILSDEAFVRLGDVEVVEDDE